MTKKEKLVLQLAMVELLQANKRFPAFNSSHEGYAVLLEEVDELWDEVKKKSGIRSRTRMAREAIQVAAMGMRFLHGLIDDDVLEQILAEDTEAESTYDFAMRRSNEIKEGR